LRYAFIIAIDQRLDGKFSDHPRFISIANKKGDWLRAQLRSHRLLQANREAPVPFC